MKRKISICVIIPEYNDRYDFLVPECMTVCSFLRLAIKMINNSVTIVSSGAEYGFLHCDTGLMLPEKNTLQEFGFTDGTELILMKRG